MNISPKAPLRVLLQTLAETAAFRPAPTVTIPADWSHGSWESFIQLAMHHRVGPLLAYRAQCGQLPAWPPAVMRRLQKALHTTRLRHAAGCRALEQIAAAFTHAGLDFVPLKGPSLADAAYPDTGLRPFDDLDLLVEPDQVAAAHAALASLGYQRLPGTLPAWFVRKYHFHTQWLHAPTRQCVELHWRPADNHGLPDTPNGTSTVRELRDNPAAMAIYIAIHIAKHGFANHLWLTHQIDPLLALHPWSEIRLLWLLDFQGLCAAQKLDPDTLTDTARRWGSLQALAFVQHLIGPGDTDAGGIPAYLPRYSPKASLLRRMHRDLDQTTVPTSKPWGLRANRHTGFRPVRLLDFFERKTPCNHTP